MAIECSHVMASILTEVEGIEASHVMASILVSDEEPEVVDTSRRRMPCFVN